jgi:hypothetical protein
VAQGRRDRARHDRGDGDADARARRRRSVVVRELRVAPGRQFTASGDDERVVITTTHGELTGSDGSTYRIREVAHVVVGDAGTVRVWFDRSSCSPV